jgi:hypothetical protein
MMAVDRALATADDPIADGQVLEVPVWDYPSYVSLKNDPLSHERIDWSINPPQSKIYLAAEKYWIGDKLIYRWSVDIGECV